MSTRISLLTLGFFVFLLLPFLCSAESSTCLTVYKEGGAPAVFLSPKCPRWNLFPDDNRRSQPVYNCQVAVHQGRRQSQEDRAVCAVDVRIPFVGINTVKEINLGIMAVFDGHNGAEASEMASKLLLEYLFLHVHFLLDGFYSATLSRSIELFSYNKALDMIRRTSTIDMRQHWPNFNQERYQWILPRIFDNNIHLQILKESLLRTIHDIDATFSKEALRKNIFSGSTATVALIADDQILVVNVGDSKAILCSESFNPPYDLKGREYRLKRRKNVNSLKKQFDNSDTITSFEKKYMHVKELTQDHHPDRDDERKRVEAAGGYVEWLGVPRVNGEIAVSRAIGDVSFKSYGVISTPEVMDWQPLGSNDSYLVVGTDGIFDKLTTQDTCDLLWDAHIQSNVNPEFIFTVAQSMADYIVKNAFERGTIDNLAVVVVPLKLYGISQTQLEDNLLIEARKGGSYSRFDKFGYNKSGNNHSNSSLISMEYFNQITQNFNRLVVLTNNKALGCFYLSENLNEKKNYDFLQPTAHKTSKEPLSSYGLSKVLNNNGGEDERLYNKHTFCSLFGLDCGVESENKYPGIFENLHGLLDSFPSNDTGFNFTNPPEYKVPDFRYKLEKQFGGGSFGEVWLAFQWDCSEGGVNAGYKQKKLTCFAGDMQPAPNACNMNLHDNSSCGCHSNFDIDDSYILKRIKVEKGNIALWSGLREKYFGEMFLKKILAHECLISSRSSMSSSDAKCNSFNQLQVDKHSPLQTSCAFNNQTKTTSGGLKHIARFVEYFVSPSEGIWLVFHNEGVSLKKHIYAEVGNKANYSESDGEVGNIQMLQPSPWWHWLKTTKRGRRVVQNIIYQLLLALKACHDLNITHRDIKPDNIIICFEDVSSGRCLRRIPKEKNYHPRIRLIDFGSAIDEFTLNHIYGSGPTRSEQTFAYAAPEALLNARWFQSPHNVTVKYDMWSVGVVMMELILGSPNIFESSARSRAVIYHQLEGLDSDIKELAYKLDSYLDMCVIIPGIFPRYHDMMKCSEESFSDRIKRRDPLKLGFPNIWALRFVRQLLVWKPEDRLSVDDALQHPYFQFDP